MNNKLFSKNCFSLTLLFKTICCKTKTVLKSKVSNFLVALLLLPVLGISQNSTPHTSATATPDTICQGNSSVLTGDGGTLGDGANWYWYTGSCGVTLVGTGLSTTQSPTATTIYYVRAEGTSNTTTCVSATVAVNSNSTGADSAYAISPILAGTSTTLGIIGGSLGTGANWFWYSGSCGGTFEGSGASLVLTPNENTTYYVRAEGNCNTTSCSSVIVSVLPVKPFIKDSALWIIRGDNRSTFWVDTYYAYNMLGDTTIGSYTYKKVYKYYIHYDTTGGYPHWQFPLQIDSSKICAFIRENGLKVYAIQKNIVDRNNCAVNSEFLLYDYTLNVNSPITECILEDTPDTVKMVDTSYAFYGRDCLHTKKGYTLIQGIGSNKGLFEKMQNSQSGINYSLYVYTIGTKDSSNILRGKNINANYFRNPPENFYQFMDEYFSTIENDEDTNKFEHGIPEIENDYKIWGKRLFPSGDFSIAATAMTEWGENFNKSNPICTSPSNPPVIHWTELGPFDNNSNFDNVNFLHGVNSYANMGIGLMDRITFDPKYSTNQTIYAVSNFGGLWKSTNSGNDWFHTGTDNYMQIPQTTVADVAVDYNNSNIVFICTGYGDGGIYDFFENNQAKINPEYTYGIFRSTDGGTNWQNINNSGTNGFMTNLGNNTVCRRMVIDPTDGNNVYVATSKGIYKSNDALNGTPGYPGTPTWTCILTHDQTQIPSLPDDFRGLEIKPATTTTPQTIYASSRNGIYKSTDGGNSWIWLTNPATYQGLDLSQHYSTLSCASGIPLTVARINIAVASNLNGEENEIYAYVLSALPASCSVKWNKKLYRLSKPDNNGNQNWINLTDQNSGYYLTTMPIVASPINPNVFYHGEVHLWGQHRISTNPSVYHAIPTWAAYPTPPIPKGHDDVRALVFEPIPNNPKLFVASDGGINSFSIKTSNPNIDSFTSGWNNNNGLGVSTIWEFDDNETNKDQIVVGLQDCGTDVRKKNPNSPTSYIWDALTWSQGDGYAGQICYDPQNITFLSGGDGHSGYLYSYDQINNTYQAEACPDVLDQYKVIKDFNTEKKYFSFVELYRIDSYSGGSTWTQCSDIVSSTPDPSNPYLAQVVETRIADNNSNYVYHATVGNWDGTISSGLQSQFLLSTDFVTHSGPLAHFTNLTPNISSHFPNSSFIITGVAVSSTDEHKVWVTFSGYDDANKKVWYSTDDGAHWYNADPYTSIPNIAINNIVYQDGSDDRLYIATDAGVYYKDNSMQCWERCGDMPNCMVLDLKINYCAGLLRVATYGRGVWETDLLPITNLGQGINQGRTKDVATSPGVVVWNTPHIFHSNFKIPSGVTLKIQDTVYMPKDGYIFVEQGGTLIIEEDPNDPNQHGIITNGCGEYWNGIQAWGYASQNQDVTNGTCNQGRVIMTDSATIEYARVAITTENTQYYNYHPYAGGLVQATNSIFKNCKNGIYFKPYRNFYTSNNTTKNDASFIRTCTFYNDGNYNFTEQFGDYIRLEDVSGVHIYGSVFKNGSNFVSNINDLGNGITSMDANYYVWPYQGSQLQPTVFKNLKFGIVAQSSCISNSPNFFQAADCIFQNCVFGIFANGINNESIQYCTFDVGKINPSLPAYHFSTGLTLQNSSTFSVHNNCFDIFTGATYNYTLGTNCINSGSNNNYIKDGNYNGLEYGNDALGINSNGFHPPYTGLEYSCNYNTGSPQDYTVIGQSNQGIKFLQGGNMFSTSGTGTGNRFSHTNTLQYSDFDNCNGAHYVFYAYDAGISAAQPNNYCGLSIYSKTPGTCNNGCGNSTNLTHLTQSQISALSLKVNINKLELDTLKQEYTANIDGGNTQALIDTIVSSDEEDIVKLDSVLKARSPYLSKAVLKQAAMNTSAVPIQNLFHLLTINPDNLYDEDFINYMRNNTSITSEMIDSLYELRGTVTSRTQLSGEMTQLYDYLSSAAFDLIYDKLYFPDEETEINYSGIIGLLDTLNNADAAQQVVDILLQMKNFSGAMNLFNSIPSNYDLTGQQQEQHNRYDTLLNILITQYNNGKDYNNLPDSVYQKLRQIANVNDGLASARAQNILRWVKKEVYDPIFEPPVHNRSKRYKPNNPTTEKVSFIKVYPNPTENYLVVDYYLPEGIESADVIITNILGKTLFKQKITGNSGQLTINSPELPDGIYLLLIKSGDKNIYKEKFVFQKQY